MANEFTARNGLIAQKDSVVTGSLIVTSGITGSLLGTASYATQALSSSYASAYAAVFPYTGSAIISGSLEVPQISGLNTSGANLSIISTNNATKGTIDIGTNNAESVYFVNRQFQFTNVVLCAASNANGFLITRVTPTDALPNYVTNRADTTTGVGGTINTVSLITGGSTRLKASSAGNILIGTTTDAGFKLDVQGTSRFNGNIQISGSGAFMAMTSDVGDAFAFRSSGAIRLEAQNVGILYASTTVTALYARGTGANIVLANQTTNFATMFGNTGNLLIQSGGTATDAGFRLDVSGSTRLNGTVYASGSVSINYPSLSSIYKLGVSGSAVVKEGGIVVQDDSGNYLAYTTDGLTQIGGLSFNRYLGPSLYSSNTNPIKLLVNGSELARINATNVTLGSTNQNLVFTPTTGNPTLIQTGTTSSIIRSTSGTRNLQFENYSGDSNYLSANGAPFTIRTTDSQNILFRTNNLVAGNISSAQNWTLGGSTDAGFKLDVQGTSRFNGNTQITGSINQGGIMIASSAVARGSYLTPILSASANSDYLVGVDIQPSYISSSYSSITPVGLRVTNPGGGVITIGQNTNFSFVNEILCTGRLDFGSTVSQLFMRGTQIYFVGPTVLTRTADASSTATQRSSYSFPMQTSLWTGAVQSLVNAGFAHKASTTVNLASRLAAVVNTTGTDLNTSGTEALTIFSPSANVLLAASGSSTFTDDGYRLDVQGTSRFNDNMLVTGSVTATSFTGSLLGTASWAVNALTSSTTAAVNGTATFLPYFNTSTSLANTDITLSGSNYGISITTPRTKLMINNGNLSAYNNSGSGVNAIGAQIYLGDSNFQNANYYNSAPGIGAVNQSGTSVCGDLALYTYNDTPGSRLENMRLFKGGNVGIGTTTTSSYKLNVQGTSRFTGNMEITGSQYSLYFNYIYNPNAVATAAAKVQLVNAAGNTSAFSIASDSDATDPSMLSVGGSNKGIEFSSNSIRAFKIFDSTRNTIIQSGGVFVDAGYRLDVQGTSRFNGNMIVTGSSTATSFSGSLRTTGIMPITTNNINIGDGANYFGSTFTQYVYTNNVSTNNCTVNTILYGTPNGGLQFLNSASVASMKIINATNNIIMQTGGTFTDAGFKLDVQGTTRFNGNSLITGSLTVSSSITHQIIGNTNITTPATAGGTVNIVSLNNTPTLTFSQAGTAARLQITVVGGSQEQTHFKSFVSTGEFDWLNNSTNYLGRLTTNGNFLLPGSGSTTQPVDAGYRLDVSGSTRIRGYANTSISSSLVVLGSGSSQPIFTVQGSQGELFSVTDSLSGSLFSVNDISGLPVLEAFSDNTVLLGSYQAPALLTTNKIVLTASGNFTLSSLPTASYDGAFYDYTARSGSNARAGNIMAIWSGSSVNFTETTTLDFGNTTGLNLGVFVSSGNMVLTGSASTTAWTIKTIIRSI
jgi:hypothetical protein